MKIPPIYIMPIKQLYRTLEENSDPHSVAFVASSEKVKEDKLLAVPHIIQYFEDLDYEVPGRSMSRENAAQYARFAKRLDRDVTKIFCSCQAAQSRSPAMAAALYRYFGDGDRMKRIWSDPQYVPNPYVYALLCEALGVPVADCELDDLIETNRQAFRTAIKNSR